MKNKLLAKAGAVLDVLCAAPGAMSLKELSAKLNMPVPTLSRMCNDMVEMHWLEKIDYHHFAPGMAMLRFGTHAERLSPYAAAAMSHIRELSLRSGLNGILFGYDKNSFFRICSCSQKFSDHNIFRRSGAFLALICACGFCREKVKSVILEIFPDLSGMEINTLEREFEILQERDILLRVGTMRQWYITVPFVRGNIGYALTFYGQGNENANVEKTCAAVVQAVSKIRSSWGRLEEK